MFMFMFMLTFMVLVMVIHMCIYLYICITICIGAAPILPQPGFGAVAGIAARGAGRPGGLVYTPGPTIGNQRPQFIHNSSYKKRKL